MNYILIICLALAFVTVFVLLATVYRGKKEAAKKDDKKEPAKTESKEQPKEEKKEQNNKEELPEILVEVTRGNYMKDRANQYAQSNMAEVELKETKENLKPKHRIQELKVDESLEDDALNTEDIINQLDNGGNVTSSKIANEFANMSKEMKVLIISDALNKKKSDE